MYHLFCAWETFIFHSFSQFAHTSMKNNTYRISGIIRGRKFSQITFFTIVREKTFAIQAILYIKISGRHKMCKKTFTSRFAKFANFFFCGRFPIYSMLWSSFLNQVHTGRRAWFLEFTLVYVLVCVSVSVCLPPRALTL